MQKIMDNNGTALEELNMVRLQIFNNHKRAVAAHSGQKCSLFRAVLSARNSNLNGLLSTGMPTGKNSTEGDCKMKAKKLPQLDLIKSLLLYDHTTGIFTWKINACGHIRKGCKAGSISHDGYYVLCINYKRYGAHRIAWFYHYGVEPMHEIDHINRDRGDCRIVNLRDVTRIQNANNRSLQSNNTSGINGVAWNKVLKKWVANIQYKDKLLHLGYFESKDDAAIVRKLAEQNYIDFPPPAIRLAVSQIKENEHG